MKEGRKAKKKEIYIYSKRKNKKKKEGIRLMISLYVGKNILSSTWKMGRAKVISRQVLRIRP
jgi:hypothetical protein